MDADPAAPVIHVLDDDPSLCALVVFNLWRHGINALYASNAADAIAMLRHHKETLRLALIEMDLTESDGPAFANLLLVGAPSVRFCYMTTAHDDQAMADLLAMRAEHVFTKPFSIREMLARLRQMLAIHPSADV
jgi:DNA-binding response OmpR family regulator